ncbi:MAG: hypothetical protein IPN29_17095 [Saprospiraceae bacterium]|nr:hypothetical protein [Saprospiraceae bacterium]
MKYKAVLAAFLKDVQHPSKMMTKPNLGKQEKKDDLCNLPIPLSNQPVRFDPIFTIRLKNGTTWLKRSCYI